MTDKELIRRALLGDSKAQEECTEKGITLPCPFCGASGDDLNLGYNSDISQFWIQCWKCYADGPIANYSGNNAFALWNTRPAPPIGRCGECKYFYKHEHFRDKFLRDGVCKMSKTFKFDYNFCSHFEPKEGEQKDEN